MSMAIDIWDSKPQIQSIALDTKFGNLNLDIARFDALHPIISGNKYYKLHHNILNFQDSNATVLATYGGIHSNHLHAFSYLCREYDIPSMAYVRAWDGETMTPTLTDIVGWGTVLNPISRSDYRAMREQTSPILGDTMYIPEGGNNDLGVLGAQRMYEMCSAQDYDVIITSVGSGTTLKGLHAMLNPEQHLHGILSFNFDLEQFLEKLICSESTDNITLHRSLYFGNFGAVSEKLLKYKQGLETRYQLPLDLVYNARSFHFIEHSEALFQDIKDKKIIYLHTGGLQGNRFSQIDD